MLPVTILAPKKLSDLLTEGNALQQQITAIAASSNVILPLIASNQIVLSSANPDISDKNLEIEKFRSLSGTISLVVEVWASSNLFQDASEWVHFYVEGVTTILRQSAGDWGDGIYFSGIYEVQFQPPKIGGFGYVESARVTCYLNVSRN